MRGGREDKTILQYHFYLTSHSSISFLLYYKEKLVFFYDGTYLILYYSYINVNFNVLSYKNVKNRRLSKR